MVHELNNLFEVITLLSVAVFVVAFFRSMGLSPVLGYLFAGTLLGKHGLELISDDSSVYFIAEFGVVFLLFVIGMELTLERLMSMRLHVFGFGSLQTIITAVVIYITCRVCDVPLEPSIIIGGGLALSSTAIVLQVLRDNGQQSTQVGRLSLAVLLMQDFMVLPLLVLVPLLSGDSGDLLVNLSHALLKAVIALLTIFMCGRLIFRPLFAVIASFQSKELFLAMNLLVVLGTSYITQVLGLSMALGAFVAGLLVAETEYRHEVEHMIVPFKGLLLGLFFMTVGMKIDIDLFFDEWLTISYVVLSLLTFKAITIFLLCQLFRFNVGSAVHAGLLLAQGGEFAFILFNMASDYGFLDMELAQILMVAVTITMAVTPLLSGAGSMFVTYYDKRRYKDYNNRSSDYNKDLSKHVIVAGFGRVGQVVSRMLEAEQINYIVVDVSMNAVKGASDDGFPISAGNIATLDVLRDIHADRAQCIIITISNEVTVKKAVRVIRTEYPNLHIVVRVNDLTSLDFYKKMEVDAIVPDTYEAGLQLAAAGIAHTGVSVYELAALKERFRSCNYALTGIIGKKDV